MATRIQKVSAIGGAPVNVFPPPIPAQRAPLSTDVDFPLGQIWLDTSVSPAVSYEFLDSASGTWSVGGVPMASTTQAGIVELATLAELQTGTAPAGAVPTANDVATEIQAIVVGAVPAATELQAGIAEIATQAETDAGTDDTRIVTPLKLTNFIGSGGIPGSFTDLTATGAVSFTGATGAIVMTSATASSFGTTGAGIDLTLSSAAGRVVVNGEEAAADAVRILSAAGGLDVDVALQMSLVSSQNAADAIVINASAGGIDMTAAGAAGEDIDIVNTAGSVNITAGESGTDAIVLSATIGGIQINAPGAAAGEDIALTATGSSIRLVSTENVTDSIVLSSTNGGIQILTPGAAPGEDIVLTATGSSIRLSATESATDAINIEATLGGINILASGAAAGEDINLTATGSSINLSSTENAALAISLNTNGGTSETIRARNQQGTGAASIELNSTAGGITIAGGLGTADAVNITASTAGGGIDIDASTAGVIVDTTGAISLDAAAASNLTVTGAFALDLISTLGKVTLQSGQSAADSVVISSLIGGIDILAAGAASGEDIDIIATGSSVNIQATESDVNAITINASGVAGGLNVDSGTGGVIVDTTGAFSIDGAAASNVTTTGAGIDLTLSSVLGSVLVSSTEDAALAIRLHANGGTSETIQLHADQGTGVGSVNLLSDVGGLTFRATGLASADAINLEAPAGGIDVDAALQINVASSQAAATAIQLTASDAAGGITATVGTGNFNIAGNLALTSVATQLIMNGGAVTDFIGSLTLIGGTLVVANTNIAAGDRIFFSRTAVNASTALGELTYTISAGASFTVTSMGVTTATILVADVSTFSYFIVRQT